MINPPRIDKESWPLTAEEYYGDNITKLYELRNMSWYNLVEVEFQLAYHAHISIRDVDEMGVHERRTFFELLQKQKKAEEEAMKSNIKK